MGRIVNTHIHLGGSGVTDSVYTEATLLENMDSNHLDAMMVLPLSEPLPDNRTMHDRIYEFTKVRPGKIFGVVDMHPRHPYEVYFEEARRCIQDMGFVAIKLHPMLQGVNPVSKVADKAFRAANELGVPLMVHTGVMMGWTPALLLNKAKEYPDLKIVLCHAGTLNGANEAIMVAELCPNVYLEPTWCPIHAIEKMIKVLGPERVTMSSDGPINTKQVICEAKNMNLSDYEREMYMGEAAIKLYNLKIQ